jgi:hypothetical protein
MLDRMSQSPAQAAAWRADVGNHGVVWTIEDDIAVTRARCDDQTKAYIARKKAEGKTHREAIRCLKRHLIRHIWQLLRVPTERNPPLFIIFLT